MKPLLVIYCWTRGNGSYLLCRWKWPTRAIKAFFFIFFFFVFEPCIFSAALCRPTPPFTSIDISRGDEQRRKLFFCCSFFRYFFFSLVVQSMVSVFLLAFCSKHHHFISFRIFSFSFPFYFPTSFAHFYSFVHVHCANSCAISNIQLQFFHCLLTF